MINFYSVMSLLGVIIGIIALVLIFVFRIFDRDRKLGIIESRQENFNKTSKNLLKNSEKIIHDIKGIVSTHHLRPELSTYFANQWRFIEKTFHNRFEKHDLCRRIVANYIHNMNTILLDSGSSIDLVTYELLSAQVENIHVFSNNVFAAMHLVGTKKVSFQLLSGLFNDNFAAVYGSESNHRIGDLGINVFILATTAIRFEKGIMVYTGDDENRDFKIACLNVFTHTDKSKLIIAADATKFLEPLEKHRGIVTDEEWAKILKEHASRIILVTSKIPTDIAPEKYAEVEQELQKFKNGGVEVNSE